MDMKPKKYTRATQFENPPRYNDIYPGSSTHSEVVFREVLHPFELE